MPVRSSAFTRSTGPRKPAGGAQAARAATAVRSAPAFPVARPAPGRLRVQLRMPGVPARPLYAAAGRGTAVVPDRDAVGSNRGQRHVRGEFLAPTREDRAAVTETEQRPAPAVRGGHHPSRRESPASAAPPPVAPAEGAATAVAGDGTDAALPNGLDAASASAQRAGAGTAGAASGAGPNQRQAQCASTAAASAIAATRAASAAARSGHGGGAAVVGVGDAVTGRRRGVAPRVAYNLRVSLPTWPPP